MRRLAFVLVVALAAAVACGKYGPPLRTTESAPAKPASAGSDGGKSDTGKSQDPNAPAPDSNAPEPGPMP